MVDTDSTAVHTSSSTTKIPTFEEACRAVRLGNPNALDVFVHQYEPVGEANVEAFRALLASVVDEARAPLRDALEHLLGRVSELGTRGVSLPLWNALCIEYAMGKARAALASAKGTDKNSPRPSASFREHNRDGSDEYSCSNCSSMIYVPRGQHPDRCPFDPCGVRFESVTGCEGECCKGEEVAS